MNRRKYIVLAIAFLVFTFNSSYSDEFSSKPSEGYPIPTLPLATLGAGFGNIYAATVAASPPKDFGFNQLTGDLIDWKPGADSLISSITTLGTNVLLSGWFGGFRQSGTSIYRRSLAFVNAKSGEVANWDASIFGTTIEGLPIIVNSVVVSSNLLFAGGTFTKVGSNSRLNLAAINRESALATDWKVDIGKWDTLTVVRSLVLDRNRLIIGGNFGEVSGVSRTNLAMVDAATGEVKSFNIVVLNHLTPNHSGYVDKLALRNGILYLAGDFTKVGDISRAGLAAIDLATEQVTDWNPNPNGLIKSLLLADEAIYVGGKFTSIGGASRTNLAALSYTTGAALDWNPSPNDTVNTMVYTDGKLFVGGNFTQVGTNSMPYLAVFAEKGASWFGGTYVTNGVINARLFAEEGKTCLIESTTNFVQWTEIKRSQPTNGSFSFTDNVGPSAKFYRATVLP
jgi:hypothetical protein